MGCSHPKQATRDIHHLPTERPCRTKLSILGTNTTVWSYGNQNLPTILLLHGYRGDHHGLEKIAWALEEFHVVLPDLPGFGSSSPLPLNLGNLSGFAQWAQELINQVSGGEKIVLAGHSFGSIVAGATVAANPDLPVSSLILINPIAAPPILVSGKVSTIATLLFHQLAGALPSKFGDALLRLSLVGTVTGLATMVTTNRQLRRWIHRQHRDYFSTFADRDSLLASFNIAMRETVAYSARKITLPTLLIVGESDRLAPLSDQKRLARMIPTCQLEVIQGVGHLTHYETPQIVADLITRNIQENQ